jgi:type I site-specific restriction endonuclease
MLPPGQRITSNPTEADTCRQYVVPKLQAAGWDSDPHPVVEKRNLLSRHQRYD